MHGPIRERLEELLNAEAPQADLSQHLASCSGCAAEVKLMKEQSNMLHALRSPGEMEADPGFYARVLQRIEENGVYSIWSVFTDGSFGTWLAFASLALALAIGTWVVRAEKEDGHLGSSEPVIAQESPSDLPAVAGDKAHQRDVVLVNLASYSQQSE